MWGRRKLSQARAQAEAACNESDVCSALLNRAIDRSVEASQTILDRFIRVDEDEKNRGGNE